MPRGLPAYNVVDVPGYVPELYCNNSRVSTVRAVRARRTPAGGPVNSGGTSRGDHIICVQLKSGYIVATHCGPIPSQLRSYTVATAAYTVGRNYIIETALKPHLNRT